MSPETLLKHFDRLADTPDAIPRLRRFILELAVRGKLVPQDPKDERASTVDSIDMPFRLPLPWQWKSVGELGNTQTGSTPPTGEMHHYNGNIPFIKPAAINNGVIKYEGQGLTESGARKSTVVQAGAILMVCIGGSIGKAAIVNQKVCFNQQINSVSPIEGINTQYLFIAMQSPYFKTLVVNTAAQGTLPIISKGKWERLLIPVPPFVEQHRIVTKVDELMALCVELEVAQTKRERRRDRLAAATLHGLNNGATDSETYEKVPFEESARFYFAHFPRLTTRPEHIQELRQTILNLAVRGKLVPQDPKDEPASELLQRLQIEKEQLIKDGKIRKQSLHRLIDADEKIFEIPQSWKWVRLGDVAALFGGYAYKSDSYVKESSNQVIRLGNVKNDMLLLKQKPVFIPDSVANETLEFLILPGDILITMTGTKAKRDYAFTAIVKDSALSERRLFLNQRVGAIRPFKREFVPLINIFFKADVLLDSLFATSTGTANQGNIGSGAVLSLPIPIPPLAEQQRIIAKVDALLTMCDELEARISATATIHRKCLEAILEEALNALGELKQEAYQ